MVAQGTVVVVLGLVFGSFLLTMAQRLQRQDSLTRRSACDDCGSSIGVIGLIPILGYLIHRGRCAACGKQISWIYPLTELLNAGLALAIFMQTGWDPAFLRVFLIFEALLLIAVLDSRTHLIFPQPVIAALLVQSIWLGLFERDAILDALIGLFLGAGVFHWVGYLYQAIRNRVGLGEGDATLLGLIGFAFGWQILFTTVFWSAVFGILCGGGLLLLKRQSLGDEIAFGPWLVLAAFLIWYFPGFFEHYPFDTAYLTMLPH